MFLHQQGLDTSTTAGKAMFQMLGVFAEFERGHHSGKGQRWPRAGAGKRQKIRSASGRTFGGGADATCFKLHFAQASTKMLIGCFLFVKLFVSLASTS